MSLFKVFKPSDALNIIAVKPSRFSFMQVKRLTSFLCMLLIKCLSLGCEYMFYGLAFNDY